MNQSAIQGRKTGQNWTRNIQRGVCCFQSLMTNDSSKRLVDCEAKEGQTQMMMAEAVMRTAAMFCGLRPAARESSRPPVVSMAAMMKYQAEVTMMTMGSAIRQTHGQKKRPTRKAS